MKFGFRTNISYLAKIWTVNGILYTVKYKLKLMMQLSVKVQGYIFLEYIASKKAILCCHEQNRQLLVKENFRLRVFSVSQFLFEIAEDTTKKAQISYESFPRLVKLIIENYLGQIITCSFLIYKINQISRHFVTFLISLSVVS